VIKEKRNLTFNDDKPNPKTINDLTRQSNRSMFNNIDNITDSSVPISDSDSNTNNYVSTVHVALMTNNLGHASLLIDPSYLMSSLVYTNLVSDAAHIIGSVFVSNSDDEKIGEWKSLDVIPTVKMPDNFESYKITNVKVTYNPSAKIIEQLGESYNTDNNTVNVVTLKSSTIPIDDNLLTNLKYQTNIKPMNTADFETISSSSYNSSFLHVLTFDNLNNTEYNNDSFVRGIVPINYFETVNLLSPKMEEFNDRYIKGNIELHELPLVKVLNYVYTQIEYTAAQYQAFRSYENYNNTSIRVDVRTNPYNIVPIAITFTFNYKPKASKMTDQLALPKRSIPNIFNNADKLAQKIAMGLRILFPNMTELTLLEFISNPTAYTSMYEKLQNSQFFPLFLDYAKLVGIETGFNSHKIGGFFSWLGGLIDSVF
jgi:hypothetical protein